MKFPISIICSACHTEFSAVGYGEDEFPTGVCPNCHQPTYIIDPLTFSVISVRLLLRAKHEIGEADYTVSIVSSAMAIECAITRLYIKWRTIAHEFKDNLQTTDADQEAWETEYRKKTSPGGFGKAADFVCKYLTGKNYDAFIADFYAAASKGELIGAELPASESEAKVSYVHTELFRRWNRIMHWGKVTFQKEDAEMALTAAYNAFAALKVIDREKWQADEKERLDGLTGLLHSV
jgi:hypothetical protein